MTRRHDILLLSPAELLLFNRFGVRLRWAACLLATAVALLTAVTDFYPEFPGRGAVAVALFVAAYNGGAWGVLHGMDDLDAARRNRLAVLQRTLTLLDQLTLAAALALLGGLEMFTFPVLLLAMFMVAINSGKRESYGFWASMLLFLGGLFLLQRYAVLPYRDAIPARLLGNAAPAPNLLFAAWWSPAITWCVLAVLLYAVVYFANFVKDKHARVFSEILAGRQEITSLRKLSADVLDIFPFAVITLDARHAVVESANPAAAGMLGAHPGWIGRSVSEIDDLTASGLSTYLQRAMHGDEIKVIDYPFLRADSRKRYLSIHIFVARLADGSVDKVLLCAEDVTERLGREQEQRELQQALLQTEKMASLGQMATGVAHELNNPLTAIDAYAQFLAYRLKSGESLGPESLQRIERILENSDRIRILVKNLLSYARPAPETSTPLQVTTVIDESLILCEHDLRHREITLVRRYGDALPRVVGNKTQLQQVFINLVTNAAHAVAPGGRIEIEVIGYPGTVEVVIRDDGHGIDRANLDRIFEPFFTTKQAGQGTGLGLSIVMTILEKHHGSVRVESEPGRGTAFHLRFPADDS